LAVKEIIKRTRLSFDFIVTREFSLDRYEQLKTVIRKFNADPREVLFVGNGESDKKAAEKIGCNFLLAEK